MKSLRTWSTRHATAVITPSEHLRRTVRGWSGRDDVVVVPNGVRTPGPGPARTTRPRPGWPCCSPDGSCPGSASSCSSAPSLELPDAHLDIVGDGPEAATLQPPRRSGGGVRTGSGSWDRWPHDDVMERMQRGRRVRPRQQLRRSAARAHRSAGVGNAGGRDPRCRHGRRDRRRRERGARRPEPRGVRRRVPTRSPPIAGGWPRLREGAAASGRDWTIERCTDRIEGILGAVTKRRPRAVFLGKNAVTLDDDHREKFTIHGRYLDSVVLCSGTRSRVERAPGVRVVALPTGRPKLISTPVFYTPRPVGGPVRGRGSPAVRDRVPEPLRGGGRARVPAG